MKYILLFLKGNGLGDLVIKDSETCTMLVKDLLLPSCPKTKYYFSVVSVSSSLENACNQLEEML